MLEYQGLKKKLIFFSFLMMAVFKTLQAADPSLSAQWVKHGQQLFAQRQYDQAIQAFSNASRADNRNAAAWKGLGTSYYYKRDYPNALKYYKYAYQLDPSDAQLAAFIPKLAAAAAQPAAAVGALEMATRYYQAKQYDQAIQYYNQAISQNPNDAKAWQGLGNCYYAQQNKPKAVESYQKALQLDPGNTALQNFLASYSPELQSGQQASAGGTDWVQPLWRSALLPGWGQVYNGQKIKGLLLGGVTAGLFVGTVATYFIGSAAKDKYLSLTDSRADFNGPYSTWESMANLNHIFYIGYGAFYAFTLADAVFSAKPKPAIQANFETRPPDLELALLPEGAQLRYRLLKF